MRAGFARHTISDIALGRQDLAATVFARFQVDVVGTAALAGVLVLDVESGAVSASAERRVPRFMRDTFFLGTAIVILLRMQILQRAQCRAPGAEPASAAGLIAALAHGQRLAIPGCGR